MSISFKEKRELLKEIDICFGDLEQNPDFKTKRTLLKRIDEAFERLTGESAPKTTLLDRFLAGEFTKENDKDKMMRIFVRVLDMAKNNLEILKDGIRKFLEWHESQGHMNEAYVMESAMLPYNFEENQGISCLKQLIESGYKGSITINL